MPALRPECILQIGVSGTKKPFNGQIIALTRFGVEKLAQSQRIRVVYA
jgi:hypothetical protein